ncbi:MAG TPA: BTAD domain-containing putative transcriptional regulator [Jiangellales bacterium]|nr:BTAD domain-containing putative transcriptional regulator [Jiangellales bacterium]
MPCCASRAGRSAPSLTLLLTAPGQVFSLPAIVEALWGEHPPDRAAKTVQSYVSRLRRALPQDSSAVVVTREPGYAAEVAPADVDAEWFRSLVAAGHRELSEGPPGEAAGLLREALDLWRGEPYGEFDAPFAAAERAALHELRLAAVEDRVTAELATGAGPELIGELDALLAQLPPAVRRGMTAVRPPADHRRRSCDVPALRSPRMSHDSAEVPRSCGSDRELSG